MTDIQASDAVSNAQKATDRAKRAIVLARSALDQLQAEAEGECYRVNVLRYSHNVAAAHQLQADRTIVRFLSLASAKATKLKLPFRLVAGSFAGSARVLTFEPLVDCAAATEHPRTYRVMRTVPLASVPAAVLRAALASPPEPPASAPPFLTGS